jgi:hypothetical protein
MFNNVKINDKFTLDDISKINDNVDNIKLLIVSFDNRKNLDYLEDHNINIKRYCEKYKKIEYEFSNFTNKNVYWYKLYLILEKILTNKYDYVMWMDTDTMIVNHEIDIRKILLVYNTDIYIGHETLFYLESILNAGVFIIKNSTNGVNFIKELIYYFENSKCLNTDNSLNGIYGLSCYEQGAINNLIKNKYSNFTTILPKYLILNGISCNDENTFIIHKFGSQSAFKIDVKSCFNKINNKINNKLI